MDPVSMVFAAYLNTVQSTVTNHLNETRNIQVTPVAIEYEGTTVSYQHQHWQVRSKSVCANYRQNIRQFSPCTVKAAQLFNALCTELRQAGSDDWRQAKIQNMYCNAALSFQPTVANVGAAQALSGMDEARQACNAATVAAMGNSDPRLARERDKTCAIYRSMKAKN